jgi:NAD(P)-dependent dehydrogenase (short-subunit alcohol dehydrogenase family)
MSDRLAVVTGTSAGIGTALAQALLDDGWTVVGLSRRRASVVHPAYRHLQVDLGDLGKLKHVGEGDLAPVLRQAGWHRVGLVNNAASAGDSTPVAELDPLHLARALAVNSIAPVFLMGLVIGNVPPGVPLRIVNVSSGAAVRGMPGMVEYCSSKAALRLASMCVADELQSADRPGGPRPDAAVVSYAPGVVDTPMQEEARAPGRLWNQLFVDMHAQGQLQPPELPAAEIAAWLSSDPSEPFAERRFGVQ